MGGSHAQFCCFSGGYLFSVERNCNSGIVRLELLLHWDCASSIHVAPYPFLVALFPLLRYSPYPQGASSPLIVLYDFVPASFRGTDHSFTSSLFLTNLWDLLETVLAMEKPHTSLFAAEMRS